MTGVASRAVATTPFMRSIPGKDVSMEEIPRTAGMGFSCSEALPVAKTISEGSVQAERLPHWSGKSKEERHVLQLDCDVFYKMEAQPRSQNCNSGAKRSDSGVVPSDQINERRNYSRRSVCGWCYWSRSVSTYGSSGLKTITAAIVARLSI